MDCPQRYERRSSIFRRATLAVRIALVVCVAALLIKNYRPVGGIIRWILYLLFLPITFTLTLRLDGWRILLFFMVLALIAYLVIYYFILRRYSRYRAPPPLNSALDQAADASTSLSSLAPTPTPADLLAKIRIFGYLEPDVYAELLRAVEERTVTLGQSIRSEGSFTMVVEGSFELRVRRAMMPIGGPNNQDDDEGEDDEEARKPMSNEIVLGQVKSGGILSSLFDILTVLTGAPSFPYSSMDLMEDPRYRARKVVVSPRARLLLIPETALRRVAQRHPRAAAHMIQIIMSRFHRVTLMTLHRYLGLSMEALYMVRTFNSAIKNPFSLFDDPNGGGSGDLVTADPLYNISDMSRPEREKLQSRVYRHLVDFLKIKKNAQPSDEVANLVTESISLISLHSQADFVARQGERNPGLIVLLQGSLQVICEDQGEKHEMVLRRPGSLVGLVSSIFGHRSLVSATRGNPTAKEADEMLLPTIVAVVNRVSLEMIVERSPGVVSTIARRLLRGISPLVKLIDSALDWQHLEAGQTLCYQGDPANHIHMVLHGRLRAISDDPFIPGRREFGDGDSLGELEILQGDEGRWRMNVQAVRDSEVASMPKHLFKCLAQFHPEITLNISRMLASKTATPMIGIPRDYFRACPPNYRTVAIVPMIAGMHGLAMAFAQQLHAEASSMDTSLLLEKAIVSKVLGKHAFRAIGQLKLLEWLQLAEQEYRLVLYVADSSVQSPWTQRCIRQADCILVVTRAAEILDEGASLRIGGSYEPLVMGSMARKELVLIHETLYCPSGLTRKWLDARPWISAHHHVCLPAISLGSSIFDYSTRGNSPIYEGEMGGKSLWDTFVDQARKFTHPPSRSTSRRPYFQRPFTTISTNDDIARLARVLLGRAVGLVLGGGGAKGMAHLGMIQALVEAGVPIDAIGGTSIGSFIGALYARDVDYYTAIGFARQLARRLCNHWYYLLDLTYPITSWFTGHSFNRGLWKIFREKFIEDLWLPYFAVTADIAHSRMMVHRGGFVWRYVRASMSLCGFLPPLCDRGALLVDGGYLDNVPVEVMFQHLPVAKTIAIDVGRPDEIDLYDYGDTLSGLWLLLWRWLGRPLKIPTLTDIQQRLAFVSCTEKLAKVRAAAATKDPDVLYLHPPVENYEVMDWTRAGEILKLGYAYGRQVIEGWRKDGTLTLLTGMVECEAGGVSTKNMAPPTMMRCMDNEEDRDYLPEGAWRRGSEAWDGHSTLFADNQHLDYDERRSRRRSI